MSQSHPAAGAPQGAHAELVDAVMRAGRVFVGIAAQCLAEVAEDVSIPQFRLLVLVTSRGPRRAIDLAAALDVNPSTVTRLIDRLVRAGLVRKDPIRGDKRSHLVDLTPAGAELVAKVSQRRREEFAKLLAKLPADRHQSVIDALGMLADVAEEPHEAELLVGLTRPLTA